MGERLVSDEDIDLLVEQRLAERKKVVEEVVAALQPQLEGIRKEAANANHVKRTLGRQLSRLEGLVKQTNAELGRHVVLPAHPGTADVINRMETALEQGEELTEQFGVDGLSLEQKQALPGMLKGYLTAQVDRQKLDRRDNQRRVGLVAASTFIGAMSGAIVAILAVLAALHAKGLI